MILNTQKDMFLNFIHDIEKYVQDISQIDLRHVWDRGRWSSVTFQVETPRLMGIFIVWRKSMSLEVFDSEKIEKVLEREIVYELDDEVKQNLNDCLAEMIRISTAKTEA